MRIFTGHVEIKLLKSTTVSDRFTEPSVSGVVHITYMYYSPQDLS